jgi:hypothetical protein
MRLLEGLLNRFVLGFQNFKLGIDFVDGGALVKQFCKAESKFKLKYIFK